MIETRTAPHPNCSGCLLYRECQRPLLPVAADTRKAISGRDPASFPLVMLVAYKPAGEEDRGGRALSAGFEAEMLLDYLSILEARWVYTHLVRCEPAGNTVKTDHLRACRHFFEDEVARYDPAVIVPLGKAAFEALWPADQGKPPAVTRARTTPTKLASGRWLVPVYDPNMHRHWLESGGSKGQDLSTEYVRAFTLVDQLLTGSWAKQDYTYTLLSTQDEFEGFLAYLDRHGVTVLDHVDIEDDTWWSSGSDKFSPYKFPHLQLESKLTMWHPGNRLTALGVTVFVEGEYRNFQIEPSLVVKDASGLPNQNLLRLLRGRHFEAWNSKTELNAFEVYCGVKVDDLIYRQRVTVGDGMLRHGTRDRGNPDGSWNSLKKVAQNELAAPDWSKEIEDAMAEDRKQSGLPVSSTGRVPKDVNRKYNTGDTYWGARLVREKQLGKDDWPEVPYRTLIEGLPFVCAMERVGVPCNDQKLLFVREQYLAASEQHRAVLFQQPEFLAAAAEVKMPLEAWTPDKVLFYQNFVSRMGEHVHLRTATGKISRDQDQILAWAGEPGDTGQVPFTGAAPTPWEQKTTNQKIWTVWHRTTRFKTDSTKFSAYADYCVDGFIHPSYWMIRAESGEGSEGVRGAISGRFSCIAQGMKVEMPRDLRRFPEGVPIEDVRAGDMVWSYDEHGTLLLKKVLWAGQTGVRETVRLRWRGQGNRSKCGELVLTPEHRVRLLDGSWREARDLRRGDRIMSLSRGVDACGYPRLWAARGLEEKEHVRIGKLLGLRGEGQHLHHRDGCKQNNSLDNLEGLTPADHSRAHAEENPGHYRGLARYLHTPEARERWKATHRTKGWHVDGMPFSRFRLLRMLASCQGGPKKVADRFGYQYVTIAKWCRECGIDPSLLSRRYSGDGRYLSRGRVLAALKKPYTNTNDVQKELRVGYYRVRELCDHYGLQPLNHEVVEILPGPTVPVYDLTVEGTECFIAEGLAVHNSTINVQNLFNDLLFRLPFEITHVLPGWVIVGLDYSQIELVWVARNTGDDLLSGWVRDGVDLHMAKGSKLFVYRTGRPEDEYWASRSREEFALVGEPSKEQKPWRKAGKTLNFAQTYQQEPETLAKTLGISVEEAYALCMAEDQMHPSIREAKIRLYDALQNRETIVSGWGDRRSCRGWQTSSMDAEAFLSWDPEVRKLRNRMNVELFKSVWNTSIAQGDASMMTFWQGKEIYKRLQTDPNWLNPEWVLPSRFEHDALYWLMPEHYVSTAVPEMVKMMESTANLPVEFPLPLRVGVEIGTNLAEMKEWKP